MNLKIEFLWPTMFSKNLHTRLSRRNNTLSSKSCHQRTKFTASTLEKRLDNKTQIASTHSSKSGDKQEFHAGLGAFLKALGSFLRWEKEFTQ